MRYKPGETILIVVSQPATLTIFPQHMVSQTALIYIAWMSFSQSNFFITIIKKKKILIREQYPKTVFTFNVIVWSQRSISLGNTRQL
jgi:hypothetical protein